jgi:hypothetical protein
MIRKKLTKEKQEKANAYFREYYKNPEAHQKHLEICRKWYAKNREKDMEGRYVWRNNNRDKVKLTEKIWRSKNKEKMKIKCLYARKNHKLEMEARQIAKRNVKLKESCEICGSDEGLELHHWNYNKPLMVNTLCVTCHNIQHIKNFQRWHKARLLSDGLLEVAI